jgi:hypothetical protein
MTRVRGKGEPARSPDSLSGWSAPASICSLSCRGSAPRGIAGERVKRAVQSEVLRQPLPEFGIGDARREHRRGAMAPGKSGEADQIGCRVEQGSGAGRIQLALLLPPTCKAAAAGEGRNGRGAQG